MIEAFLGPVKDLEKS